VLTRQARPIWQRLLHTFADDEVALARLVRVCDEALAAELVASAADAVLVADAGLLMDLLTSTIVAVDARHSRQLRTRLLQALGRGSPGELAAASAAMLATVPSAMLPRLADESAWRTASPALRQAVEQEADRRQAGSVDGSAQRSSLRTQRALARQLGLRVANPSDESTASATAPPELAADIEGPAGPPAAVAADGMRAPSLNSMNVVKYADALDHSTSLPTMPAEAMADTDHPAGATAPRLKLPNSKPVPAAHLPQRDSTAPRPSQADAARNAALRQRALARLEELQVEDAGLVILWPFIERCFALAGLLDKQRRFVDPQAQQQAVGLLAWLMFEEPEPAEYRLPLVKLLCGVPPEAPCAIDEPPPPAMCEQGLRMLAAVIEHAPALRRMQVPALRAAYLQRAGVLSVRAGMWLLRVERQPQDLLLDHFSWSWAWVALPWMTGPLQVEW